MSESICTCSVEAFAHECPLHGTESANARVRTLERELRGARMEAEANQAKATGLARELGDVTEEKERLQGELAHVLTVGSMPLLGWLRGKLTDAERALAAREQVAAVWKEGTNKAWAEAAKMHPDTAKRPSLSKAARLELATREERIAAKLRQDVENFRAVLEALSHHNALMMHNEKPFVIIDPYQHEADIAFGVWMPEDQYYVLGDGDGYRAEDFERSWKGSYELLSWIELEARLKHSVRELEL